MKIVLEVWQMGDLGAKGTFTSLEAARAAYKRLANNDECGVEVYADGKRLKAPEAWALMEGWNSDFRFGRAEKGEI